MLFARAPTVMDRPTVSLEKCDQLRGAVAQETGLQQLGRVTLNGTVECEHDAQNEGGQRYRESVRISGSAEERSDITRRQQRGDARLARSPSSPKQSNVSFVRECSDVSLYGVSSGGVRQRCTTCVVHIHCVPVEVVLPRYTVRA